MSKVTLSDVARASGVSVGTASRAMTGRGRVSADTVERVRTVAEGLGYEPNVIGRALRLGSSATIGMLVPHLENPFFADLIRAVESELHRQGYQLIIADSHGDVAVEARRLRLLLARRVDGVVIVPADVDGSIPAVRSTVEDVPLVQVDRRAGHDLADHVGVDNGLGMRLIARHLAGLGAGTALYIGGDDATAPGRERAAAFQRAAEGEGMTVVGTCRGRFDFETGVEGVRRSRLIPDAIVCGDDMIALGALGQLQRQGVRVPAQTMVTGFDGTVLATVVEPTVTTVQQPVADIARAAIEALRGRLERGTAGPVAQQEFPPSLRVGGTTDPLHRRD
ncbi:MAG: LacI family transcriptional regulator [Propionibacteriaceae bacterium]|jgi:LacI family transcriptional regulator|nr:LacI family transcriptional regulator [Propionibacteriaceae bacterium]